MNGNGSSSVIRLESEQGRGVRYPQRLWVDGSLVELRSETAPGEEIVGSVLDAPTSVSGPQSDEPVLIGIDVLARLMAPGDIRAFAEWDWRPLLPFEHSADLLAARDRVSAGDIGSPRLVELVVPLGIPPLDGWELDYAAAFSELEALVFGAHAAELLVGSHVESSTWIQHHPASSVVMHQLTAGVRVVQRIRPANSTPISGVEGEVIGDAGRLIIRREFAPGAIGVWRRESPGYIFPTIRQPKDDVQAPDSTPGGWELANLLNDLANRDERRRFAMLREDAVRLVHHMSSMTTGESYER